MKIITWNVNGLRAAMRKGAWDWLRSQNADVICLQEIKVHPEQLSEEQQRAFNPYFAIWNPAEKPGYSGVVTFLRDPGTVTFVGTGNHVFDVEGRLIQSRHPSFVLFNTYFPSGQRGYERVTYKLEFYAHLLEICDRLHAAGEGIVICGDFNTAHQEIDLRYPRQNRKTSGFLPEERAWIDTYLEHGFRDVFRERNPEKVSYTWWTYRLNARLKDIGWRLDYYLVSEGLLPRVREVIAHPEVQGSDHCPVTLELDVDHFSSSDLIAAGSFHRGG
jgi:exodeoxyribonuclease-3